MIISKETTFSAKKNIFPQIIYSIYKPVLIGDGHCFPTRYELMTNELKYK